MDSELFAGIASGFLTFIAAIASLIISPGLILIFLFWGEPDNWDKFDYMIDNYYQEIFEEK